MLKPSLPNINKRIFMFWAKRSYWVRRWNRFWPAIRRTCRSQAGRCYLSTKLTQGKQQHWLPQHKQFFESNRKLHEVVTLSVHFPGLSPYIRENERGRWRCADAEGFAAGLCAVRGCMHALSTVNCMSHDSTDRQLTSVGLFFKI